MRTGHLGGLNKAVSRAVLGCDNVTNTDDGSALWDGFVAAGGTAFDTAHIYGGGACEAALGGWLRSQRSDDLLVLVKGAHTPNCDPESIGKQLHESLDRLGLATAEVYIMHRDNPEVPVDEFVDVLDGLAGDGLINVFGGSNWGIDRFAAANAYARKAGKRAMSVLNNNLSLAHMVTPVWDGCISASDGASLAYLTETQTAHFSWSSQARGYFYGTDDATALPDGTRPEQCFDSPDNRERRRRAGQLGEELGVSAGQVAMAYVVNQPFPSFALIGPRTEAELASTLRGIALTLTPGQIAWLDLRQDTPGAA